MLYGYMVIQGEITMVNQVTVNGYLWMLTVPLRMAGWWINFHGDVEFKNVSYQAEDADIIHDISFKVKSGQTVGIIGSTGSGKSTIMNLLCRFYDTSKGEVLVDGVNVKNLDLYDLRDNIGMAMQDVFLFSDTIEGNIAYGRPNCSFEDVKKAAKMADANLFIQKMPEGYDTIVGERGVGLSTTVKLFSYFPEAISTLYRVGSGCISSLWFCSPSEDRSREFHLQERCLRIRPF